MDFIIRRALFLVILTVITLYPDKACHDHDYSTVLVQRTLSGTLDIGTPKIRGKYRSVYAFWIYGCPKHSRNRLCTVFPCVKISDGQELCLQTENYGFRRNVLH